MTDTAVQGHMCACVVHREIMEMGLTVSRLNAIYIHSCSATCIHMTKCHVSLDIISIPASCLLVKASQGINRSTVDDWVGHLEASDQTDPAMDCW